MSTKHLYKNLNIYYQNVQGLNSKLNNLKLSLSVSDYDIIILTETWLNVCVFDHELLTVVFRRKFVLTGKSISGGVLVAD